MMGLLFRFYLASKVQLDFVSLPRQLKFEQVLISIQIVASCFSIHPMSRRAWHATSSRPTAVFAFRTRIRHLMSYAVMPTG